MMRSVALPFFCFISGLLCLLAFPGALTGKTILAPVDIFPNLFEHYRYMDPRASGVPANHHIIDQATYDLPLQYQIYRSLRAGIFPWWDPYTFGGRPLLADAHINGTDPIRVVSYLLLPFPLAYNVNLILKSVLTGVGVFFLLRHFGHPWLVCGLLALSFQFAGCFALFFGHPWIQASFLYYPFLWVSWDRLISLPTRRKYLMSAVLCALIFFCGNLQSHTYLALFAIAYTAASLCISREKGGAALVWTFLSMSVGALFAAPVLLNQIEFFLLSTRTVFPGAWSILEIFRGPLSLTAVFPWLLGTFRTVDLSKAVGSGGLGFSLFVGTAPFILASIGFFRVLGGSRESFFAERVASFLVAGYLILISTPLGNFFYTRLSPMACLGLVVLAASGIRWSLAGSTKAEPRLFKMLVFIFFGLASLWAGELWFFQHFHDSIEAFFLEKVSSNPFSVTSTALRTFQVSQFPLEVGIGNPEVALSWISALCLLRFFFKSPKILLPQLLYASLVFSLFAVFLFFSRFIPCQPITLWEMLRAGGPSQQQAIQKAAASHGRFLESAPSFQNQVFPNAVASLYGVHVIHGYSALQPRSLYSNAGQFRTFPDSWIADWTILPGAKIEPFLSRESDKASCRLIWEGPIERTIKTLHETSNRLVLEISPGPAGHLIRTDTYYPGWQATSDSTRLYLKKSAPFFSILHIDSANTASTIRFEYLPRTLAAGCLCIVIGFFAIIFSTSIARKLIF